MENIEEEHAEKERAEVLAVNSPPRSLP